MQTVLLLIHLLLTLSLIVIVLLQRSEGGGLGMGSGGPVTTGRSAATAMSKVTWALGIGLFITSLALTIIAAQSLSGSSVLDRLIDLPPPSPDAPPTEGDLNNLLPPPAGDDAPLVPTLE